MKRELIALSVLALVVAAGARADDRTQALEGLWAARQSFGPQIGGHVLVFRRGDALVADIAGFTLPVRREGVVVSFELPDGKGSFRGVERGDEIIGQWVQPPTVRDARSFATPVSLHAEGGERWSGEIRPLADHMTFFLPVARRDDGTYAAYLRNPERNVGRFTPVSRLEIDGETVRLLGTPSGAKQETALAIGKRDAEADLLRIPLGPTFDFARLDDASSAFNSRGRRGSERYRYAPPVGRDDGWPVSTLEKEGISQEAIERLVQMLIDLPNDGVSSSQIHGLLIARRGRLVLEEYFHGYDRDTPHDMRSATKSWTAVLVGAAMHAGVPIRLDTPVYETMLDAVPADLDPRKRAMTLEHLLGMTAGYECEDDSEGVMQQQTEEPDWYRYTLNMPMAAAPGERIVYCNQSPHLAGGVLARIAREPLPELFDRLIGRPLQMERYYLQLTPTGAAYGGGGHHFRPRDFLKFAQLMVNDGRWNGRQIFSGDWARRSGARLRDLSPTQGYGYLWNSHEYPYRGRTVHAFFAAGNGGQIFMGIPELDLVIGFTGGNYGDRQVLRIPQRVFIPEHILPAVK